MNCIFLNGHTSYLADILTSSGIVIEEPDKRRMANILRPKYPTYPGFPPMVSIPMESASAIVREKYRETMEFAAICSNDCAPKNLPLIQNNYTSNLLDFSNDQKDASVSTSLERTFEVEKAMLQHSFTVDEVNKELVYLRTSLSLCVMEADFLRKQLEEFNKNARSILELIQVGILDNNHFFNTFHDFLFSALRRNGV